MKTKKAFTLIELLVVISIIGILVAVGAVSYQRATKLSRDSKRKTDLEQVRQALETYRSEIGTYPPTASWQAALTAGYITKIPADPQNNVYAYVVGNTATTYALCASLEIAPSSPVVPICSGQNCGVGSCNYEVDNP